MKRSWLVYLMAGALGGAAYYFLPGLAKSGPFFNVLGLSSVGAILIGIRRHDRRSRLPWILFATGQALFITGDVITYNYQRFFHTDIPFPSIGDFFYLSVYPCLIAGILFLIHRRNPHRDRASLIDSLIIAIGVGLLSWTFLMAPYAHDHTLSVPVKLVSMAYPLMDVLLLAVTVRLTVGAGRREPAFYLLTAGVVALLVTDAAYGLIQLSGVIYQNGGPLEAGWLSFYLLWGAAALHPSARSLGEQSPRRELRHPRRRLAMLAAMTLMSPAINVIQISRGALVYPAVVSSCSAVLFVLVFVRMSGLMVDINKHHLTERQLRETEAKYRSLVEGLPAVVYIAEFGEHGRWLYVSPQIESILGFTAEEWMASPDLWSSQVHPEDREKAFADEVVVQRTGEPMRSEYRIRSRDGRLVWIREEAEVLRDEAGEFMYLQGVMYDISDEKFAESMLLNSLDKEKEAIKELRALHEMQNTFLEAVSHDLRTPLTTILGSALTLEREDIKLRPEDGKDLIRSISQNARKLARLLTDLLDLDRLSRGIVQPERVPVDLRQLIASVLSECDLGGHEVHVDAPAGTASLDPKHTERIIENLIRNAVRYTSAGTPIWVRASFEDEGLLLMVEDAGRGVPQHLRDTIFEPFRQGSQTVRHSPGVGIGLSRVSRFAQLHGGKAWVQDREGGGASFRVLFPAADAGLSPEPLVESARSH